MRDLGLPARLASYGAVWSLSRRARRAGRQNGVPGQRADVNSARSLAEQ